jgi:hypothetical protein
VLFAPTPVPNGAKDTKSAEDIIMDLNNFFCIFIQQPLVLFFFFVRLKKITLL